MDTSSTTWSKSWADVEDPVVLPEGNLLVRTPACWTRVEKTVRGSCAGAWMGQKVPHWECPFCSSKTRIVLNLEMDGNTLIFTNQLRFLLTYNWDALNVKVKPNENIQTCGERSCELANKKTEQLYKVSSPCLMIIISRTRNLNQLENCLKYAHKIVFKCLYLARIGGPDILWSVNKLARSVTKRTGACDKRLARLISYVHQTSDCREYCHVGKTAQHCRLGLFQDSDFGGDFEDSKSTCGGLLCIFGSRTFVLISWMHSSTGSEIISLDAGLRMDGLLALDLWDVVLEVLRSSNSTKPPTNPAPGNCSPNHKSDPKHKKTEMWSTCRMWTTSPQTHTLLKVSLCCTSLRTMKQC